MFDQEHRLKDQGAVTSSGYGQVDSADKVVNLGNGLVRGNLIVDVSSVKISAGNELYQIHLMGGVDSNFNGGVALASKEIGHSAAVEGTHDAKPGRFVIPFQNEERGVIYPYARVRHVLSGTSPSINYAGRLEKNIPMHGRTSIAGTTTTTTSTTTSTTS